MIFARAGLRKSVRRLVGDDSNLLEERSFVRASPTLDHLAVFEFGDLQSADFDLLAGGQDLSERTAVCAGEGVGEGDGVLVPHDGLGRHAQVGEGGAHSGEEHSIAGRAGDLSLGGVVVDAVRGDDLFEEVEFARVDGFSELAKCGLYGFFTHCALPFRLCETKTVLYLVRPHAHESRSRFRLRRKRGSQHYVNDSGTLHNLLRGLPHSGRNTIGDERATHRKLDRRRVYLCAGESRKCGKRALVYPWARTIRLIMTASFVRIRAANCAYPLDIRLPCSPKWLSA